MADGHESVVPTLHSAETDSICGVVDASDAGNDGVLHDELPAATVITGWL